MTEAELRGLIEDQAPGIDAQSIPADTRFVDAGLDSLDHVTLLLAVEEQFGVTIPDEDVDKCGSIAEILQYVARQQTS